MICRWADGEAETRRVDRAGAGGNARARSETSRADRGDDHGSRWARTTIYMEPAGAGSVTTEGSLRDATVALTAIVALLLLLACTNVASMMVARGAARRAGDGDCASPLGAESAPSDRQVLTESLLLSVAGGLLGVFPGVSRRRRVGAITSPDVGRQGGTAPRGAQRPGRSAGAAVRRRCRAGDGGAGRDSFPRGTRSTPPTASLREIGAAGNRNARQLFGQGLVVAQVTLSLVLLSAAGILSATSPI